MIADTGFHCRSNPQRLVNPPEVVIHEVQGDRVLQVLDLLREGVRKPREAAVLHPNGEVLPLNVAG